MGVPGDAEEKDAEERAACSDGLARLALCSKALYDRTVLEQQRQLEEQRARISELELELFWREFGRDAFRNACYEFNFLRTRCACVNCMVRGTADEDDMPYGEWRSRNTFACVWQAPFEAELRRRGLSVAVAAGPGDVEYHRSGFRFYRGERAHLVVQAERRDWVFMGIGAILGEAGSASSPELALYRGFIEDLSGEYGGMD